jgi:hypothetical protein
MMSWRALCFALLLVFLAGILQHSDVDPVGLLMRLCVEATHTYMRFKLEFYKHCWFHIRA